MREINVSAVETSKGGRIVKKILVNGLTESAGKTTAALALYSQLEEAGEVSLFKPLAGNNYWYDYPVVMEGVREGRLYGKDAKLFSERSGIEEEVINPLHRLWAPVGIVGGRGRPGDDVVLLDRICDGEGTRLLIDSRTVVPDALSPLTNGVDRVERYSDEEEHDEYINSLYPPAFRNSLSHFERADVLIVESYSDVSLPYMVEGMDLAVTVEPGAAHVSDGEKFEEANSMVRGVYRNYGFEETRTTLGAKIIFNKNNPCKH
ncbi:hypothetical protein AKJ36_00735 [candidate division MSBL1 archaeon SCGC-AAA259I07]|uniref:Uncharacterized protein n=1 Tax=candidate division MSBL1 archaeon SCGC-AAA259I07 TaxID=1698266 RepID=A0A133UMM1_9EURY|nr:hypothetical protein AKJ36_00735 [candidate division MSBL1 archaeon SCGC-AAA259I07]